MNRPNHEPQLDNTTSEHPYHSASHDGILELMRENGGDAPLAPHIHAAHMLAAENTHQQLCEKLGATEREFAEAQATARLLRSHLENLRQATAIHLASKTLPL